MYEDFKEHIKNMISYDMEEGKLYLYKLHLFYTVTYFLHIFIIIGNNPSLALTTDGWTSHTVDSYISLTVHYISKNFELKHYMLHLIYVAEKRTSTHIKNNLLNCLSEWNLD